MASFIWHEQRKGKGDRQHGALLVMGLGSGVERLPGPVVGLVRNLNTPSKVK